MPDQDAGPDVAPVGRLRCLGRVAAGMTGGSGSGAVQNGVT